MLQRVITSFVGLAVFFAVLFANRIVFSIAVGIISLGILYEIYRAMKAGLVIGVIGILSAAAGAVSYYFYNTFTPAIVFSVMLFLAVSVFLHGKVPFKKIYSAAFISWYIIVFMLSIVLLRKEYGIFSVLIIFISAWMTDVGAYFAGYFFGRHKLIPKVSPKKTVEGAIGGIVLAVLSVIVYMFVILPAADVSVIDFSAANLGYVVLMTALASVFAQIGDLAASVIKRECGIKDFGTVFPGHGGILDRFDSVVFISPFIYYFIVCVSNIF